MGVKLLLRAGKGPVPEYTINIRQDKKREKGMHIEVEKHKGI